MAIIGSMESENRYDQIFARGELKDYVQYDYKDGTRPKPIQHDCTHLMGKLSTSSFKRVKCPVTVYRGASITELESGFGQSWTLSKRQAKKFAYLYDGHSRDDATIFEATIAKKHIFAYVNDRREKEIIVDVEYLNDAKVSKHHKPKTSTPEPHQITL